MDEDTPARRGRTAAGASALGAAALLVLSFGPSALALNPSTTSPQALRAPVSAVAPPALGAAHRAGEDPDAAQPDDSAPDSDTP